MLYISEDVYSVLLWMLLGNIFDKYIIASASAGGDFHRLDDNDEGFEVISNPLNTRIKKNINALFHHCHL